VSARAADAPFLGVGVGLRPKHFARVLEAPDPARLGIDFFEAISENYMLPGGRPLRVLAQVRTRVPVVLHGVSLNIGSADPLDPEHLAELDALARRCEPAWISDHLCWTGVRGRNLHDLLPLPYTEEALAHVVARVCHVQEVLGRRILLENVSSYVAFAASQLTEWEFLREVATRADCLILLDVNNIYVSSVNHTYDPLTYLQAIPAERVQQIHLAGHEDHGTYLVDTHDHPVPDPVWQLYEAAVRHCGPVATMIERDDRIPPLAELVAELEQARRLSAQVLAAPPAAVAAGLVRAAVPAAANPVAAP
jgi:uncharacterized protein